MTISSQICKRIYQADGENRTWEYDFPILSAANLYVYVTSPDGTEEKITTGYEVNTLQNTLTYPTLASGLDPLPSGYKITLVRQSELTQNIHLTQQGTLDAAELEHGYDKLTLQVQELAEQTQRSIKYAVSSGKTGTDAAAFLAELANSQTTALNNALDSVAQTKTQLEQTVAQEQTARQSADSALQSAVNAKQNALTTAQQTAVDSGITSTAVAQIATNQENIEALDAELDETRPWQKPAEWVDIRSGAVPNSVYFLVGHSADYTTYPKFSINASVSTAANTYDVFVDGIKQATTASGSVTTLDWQTLALTSGWDVTYPAALKTHVIRITPTVSTDTFTALHGNSAAGSYQGVLWVHFNVNNALNLEKFLADTGTAYRNNVCEAVTSATGELLVTGSIDGFARYGSSLKEVPAFNLSGGYVTAYRSFQGTALKRLVFKNGSLSGNQTFQSCPVKEIITENAYFSAANYFLNYASSLKKLPNLKLSSNMGDAFAGLTSLENTFIDASQVTGLKKITFTGYADRIVALKGITVSDQAPFDGTSPQLDVKYTQLDRAALVNLFNSLPTVTDSQVCNITGCSGAGDLTATDLAIATDKGWTVTR